MLAAYTIERMGPNRIPSRLQIQAANQAKSPLLATCRTRSRTPNERHPRFSQILLGAPELAPVHKEQLGKICRSGEHLLA